MAGLQATLSICKLRGARPLAAGVWGRVVVRALVRFENVSLSTWSAKYLTKVLIFSFLNPFDRLLKQTESETVEFWIMKNILNFHLCCIL